MLPGAWRRVLAGRTQSVADPGHPKEIGDEPIAASVPSKQYGTAGELSFDLGDVVESIRGQPDLTLVDAVRPIDGEVVGLSQSSESDGKGLSSLAGTRMINKIFHEGPALAGPNPDAGTDA